MVGEGIGKTRAPSGGSRPAPPSTARAPWSTCTGAFTPPTCRPGPCGRSRRRCGRAPPVGRGAPGIARPGPGPPAGPVSGAVGGIFGLIGGHPPDPGWLVKAAAAVSFRGLPQVRAVGPAVVGIYGSDEASFVDD